MPQNWRCMQVFLSQESGSDADLVKRIWDCSALSWPSHQLQEQHLEEPSLADVEHWLHAIPSSLQCQSRIQNLQVNLVSSAAAQPRLVHKSLGTGEVCWAVLHSLLLRLIEVDQSKDSWHFTTSVSKLVVPKLLREAKPQERLLATKSQNHIIFPSSQEHLHVRSAWTVKTEICHDLSREAAVKVWAMPECNASGILLKRVHSAM